MLIVLFLFLVIASATYTTLLKADKYVKDNITMLDDVYSVGIWDLKFNSSLYTYQAWGSSQCFSNQTCRASNIKCVPCNWTDPDICSGKVRGPNSMCPCGTPPYVCYPSLYKFPYLFWRDDQDSIIAEITNTNITDVIHHPKPPDNCSCIIYKVDTIEGKIGGVLVYDETWIGTSGNYILSRHGTITICPSDNTWGMTRIIRLVPKNNKFPNSRHKISVEYRKLPWIGNNPYSTTCTVSSELQNTHQCIPTGILTFVSPLLGQYVIRLVIDPPANQRCGVMGFWVSGLEYLLSTNPWVSPNNSTDAYRAQIIGTFDRTRPYPSKIPYCLKSNEKLYVYVLSSIKIEVMADTAGDWLMRRPLTDFPPAEYYRRLFTAVTANCPNHNYTAHRDLYSVSESMDTGSANLRMVYPSDDVDVLYPPPIFASDPYWIVRNIPIKLAEPNRLIISLFLSQRLVPRVQALEWTLPWFSNSYQWLSHNDWSKCELSINGLITDVNGNGIRMKITQDQITGGLPKCDVEMYSRASQKIDEIQKQTFELVSRSDSALIDVISLSVIQDRISSSNEFYVCKQEMQTYYTKSVTTTSSKFIMTDFCTAPFGSTEYDTDPCCQLNSTTLFEDCSVQNRKINQYSIDTFTTKIDSCASTQCAQASLTKLLIKLNDDSDPTACVSGVSRIDEKNVYWHCIDSIWGKEPVTFAGPNCTHDLDCPGSKCSIHSGRCFVAIEDAEKQLISCIYNNLTQFTSTFISNELGLNPSDPDIQAKWLDKFSGQLPCSDPYTPVGFDIQFAVYGRCQGCSSYVINSTNPISLHVLSPGPNFPNYGFDCWAPGSSSCSASTSPFVASTFCAIKGCNHIPYERNGYFPFVSASSFCSNYTFCGASDDNFFYKDVTNIIPLSNCNGATLCILGNGTKIQTINASMCETTYSCDVDCPNGQCQTEAECLASGSCSDSSDYDIGIWSKIYKTETAGCFFTIRYKKPFNPTTRICEPPFRNTIIGCSVYPGPSGMPTGILFQINQSTCESGTFVWGDPSIYELINPRWLTPAKTEAQCEAYGTVCNDRQNPKAAVLPTYTNTYSFKSNCPNSRSLFTWTRGRWLRGQARTIQVTVGKVATRWQNVTRRGLILPNILSTLTKAVDKLRGLKIQSSSFCRIAYKQYLDELVCGCISGYNESFCYKQQINTTDIGVACDEAGIISSGDLSIKLQSTSLPDATCDNLFIAESSAVLYQSGKRNPLRNLIINYNEDTNFAVRNKQHGIYGKVLTNGYSANFDTVIDTIELCIKLSVLQGYTYEKSSKFPILDLAKRPSSSNLDDLVPLNLEVVVQNNSLLCAHLSIFEQNQIYYFIERVDKNYTNVELTVFSDGEIVFISILLAQYCIGFIATVIKLAITCIIHWFTPRDIELRYFVIVFLMLLFWTCRIILFSFLLTQQLLNVTLMRAITYILIELPIFLYFAFVSNYISDWIAFKYFDVKNLSPAELDNLRKKCNRLAFFFTLIIFTIFIIVVILFETIIPPPHFICGQSIFYYDSDASFALLMAYRAFFSTIAIILGTVLFIAGITINKLILKHGDNNKKTIQHSRKVLIISIVASLALIVQAIYFLIVTATKITPVNYASLSIIMILEIIPAFMFIFIDILKVPKASSITINGRTFGSKTTKSSTKSSGKNTKTSNSGGLNSPKSKSKGASS